MLSVFFSQNIGLLNFKYIGVVLNKEEALVIQKTFEYCAKL
jgi:hypothetical protein